MFSLAKKYFPNNTLILNEATGATFGEFRGIFGGYYLLLEKLLKQGVPIGRIGIQCHIKDDKYYKNVYHSERLYNLLDTYGSFGIPLVISEIGLATDNEEVQALAAERLYRVCFSHESMSGIFWWNLDDNGIMNDQHRNAAGENLPYGALVRNGRPKAAYKALDHLINHEWHTEGTGNAANGTCAFRGFYGTYQVKVTAEGAEKEVTVDFGKNSTREMIIEI